MAYVSSELYHALSYQDRYLLNRWHYFTVDNEATVEAANYFADFLQRGGKVGDELVVYRYATALPANAAPPLGTASSSVAPAPSVVASYIVNAISTTGAATIGPNVDVAVSPPPG